MVVPEWEPPPAQEPIQVSIATAPPEEVQALLAVLLAEPVAVPQPPPVPGEALRLLPEVLPFSLAGPIPQPVPLSGPLVLSEGQRHHAGTALLRLWSHGVPGGAQELAGKIQVTVEVAEPNALSLK